MVHDNYFAVLCCVASYEAQLNGFYRHKCRFLKRSTDARAVVQKVLGLKGDISAMPELVFCFLQDTFGSHQRCVGAPDL